ncbi:hypothetical protein CFC21_082145 [Triticum aestivum]|uniref:F-box associated domain-containing protein n=2 Tax=Triticum aestivum TaxID=4565 RepID=A0A3B6NLG4_WHEAT|nr:hypothetical protein CFC21_082145 [Triticum aestivum]
MPGFEQTAYLAFEPTISPHYQVFLIPRVPLRRLPADGESDDDNPLLRSEWPPASYPIHVFSSVTQRWDEMTFLREGEAAGIIASMKWNSWYEHCRFYAVYWQSALYIHCTNDYLTRMSLLDHTYRVIKLPCVSELRGYPKHHLGILSRGVYCATLDYWNHRLWVWYLSESCGQTDWILKHDTCLKIFEHGDYAQQLGKQWILQDVSYRKSTSDDPEYAYTRDENHKALVEEKYDWNSDEDNILDTEDVVEKAEEYDTDISYFFLGFDPYKEVVFLISSEITTIGLAYDWNNSKFQYLGSSCPWLEAYTDPPYGRTDASFVYTPCWMGKFSGNELESLFEDEKLYRRELEQESQLKEESNFTYMGEYELSKHRGRAKRVKDSADKVRRRRHIAAR